MLFPRSVIETFPVRVTCTLSKGYFHHAHLRETHPWEPQQLA